MEDVSIHSQPLLRIVAAAVPYLEEAVVPFLEEGARYHQLTLVGALVRLEIQFQSLILPHCLRGHTFYRAPSPFPIRSSAEHSPVDS